MTALDGASDPPGQGEDPDAILSVRSAILMAVIGVFAFSALAVVLTFGQDLKSADNGQAHVLSRSAVGFAGLAQALRLVGEPVVINRGPLPEGRRAGLLIVSATPQTFRKAVEGLGFQGPVLVILPKWEPFPDPDHRGWVRKGGISDFSLAPGDSLSRLAAPGRPGMSRHVLTAVAAPFAPGQVLTPGPVESLRAIASPDYIPVLTDETGAPVLVRAKNARFYVLADPDLLNTQGLKSLDTLRAALVMVRAMRAGDGPFVFDVRPNGLAEERGVGRRLLEPPLLGVVLCLALAAVFAGIQAFCRFGPPRPAGRLIPLGKAALVDNTAALIRLAGKEHRMGGRYADLTAALAARAVGAPRGLGGAALDRFLDRLGAQAGAPEAFTDLASRARSATTAEKLADVARRLYQWRITVTGSRAGAPPPSSKEPS